MSRGEQMKLRLLSSMAYRPEVLLLDEPFSGLDPAVREDLSSGLLELVGEGDWTVVLASHDVDEVERMSDHAGFLVNGRMKFSEPIEDLLGRFRQVTAIFEETPLPVANETDWLQVENIGNELRFVDPHFNDETCKSALKLGGSLKQLDVRPLSLKEIFISITRSEQNVEEVPA
jgi:ABC-2 type transport system ATP-binding protein